MKHLKCEPKTIKENQRLVQELISAGIDFVPIPVFTKEDKLYYIQIVEKQLEKALEDTKEEENEES